MTCKLRKYTKEFLEPKVAQVTSITQLIALVGIKLSGGNYRLIQQRIRQHEISTSHFVGQGWARGLTKETSEVVRKTAEKNITPHDKVFCVNSGYPPGKLRYRLLQLGWKNACNICGLEKWLDKPITLHVDHINGISGDNRLENLQILCPNCHQQTDTWGNKNTNGNVVELLDTSVLGTDALKKHDGWSPSIPTKIKSAETKVKGLPKTRSDAGSVRLHKRKNPWPSSEELQNLLWSMPTLHIAKKYKVSDNMVAKWCKSYKLSKPPRGYWAKLKFNKL